jgi:hypothetical protein
MTDFSHSGQMEKSMGSFRAKLYITPITISRISKITTEVSCEYLIEGLGSFIEFLDCFALILDLPEDAVNIFLLNFVGGPAMEALVAHPPSSDRPV